MERSIVRNLLLGILLYAAANAAHSEANQIIERDGYRFESGPAPPFVVPHVFPDRWTSKVGSGAETHWRNWLLDAQVDLTGREPVRFFDTAYEVLTTDLLGEAAKYKISFNPEYERLTLHKVEIRRDGAWSNRFDPTQVTMARRESEFEQDMKTGTVTALLVLDDVRQGDVIRIAYSVAGENPILAGMTHEEFVFGWVDPILYRRARLLLPGDRDYMWSKGEGLPRPEVRKHGRHVEYTFVARDVAPIHNDGDAPRWYAPFPRLDIAPRRTWADVAAWARALYPEPKALPAELESRLAQWRALPTRDERIMAALQAVQEDVRYFGQEIGESTHRPAEPGETWRRRYGDCKDKARLLATLLGRMGIPARPALVSAERGRAIRQMPAAATAFDHVIVQVFDGAESLWLDATLTQQRGRPATMPVPPYDVALPVGAGHEDLVAIDSAKAPPDRTVVRETLTPDLDGKSAALRIETEYLGAAANRVRRNLATSGEKELARNYLEYYRRRYSRAASTVPLAIEDDPVANRVVIVESYRLDEPWVASTSQSRAIEFYAESIGSLAAMPSTIERTAPIALPHPLEVEHTVEIIVPKGWRTNATDKSEDIAAPGLAFEGTVESAAGKVVLSNRFASSADHVTVPDVGEHLRGRRRVEQAIGHRIVLDLPVAQARADRDKRLNALMRGLMEDNDRKRGEKN